MSAPEPLVPELVLTRPTVSPPVPAEIVMFAALPPGGAPACTCPVETLPLAPEVMVTAPALKPENTPVFMLVDAARTLPPAVRDRVPPLAEASPVRSWPPERAKEMLLPAVAEKSPP